MSYDYDLIVIGSGPSGFSCAMQSSKFDKKVLVVEAHEDHLGGTWINTGTVPSKSLREAAKTIYRYHTQFEDKHNRRPFERFRMEDLLQYKQSIMDAKNKKVKNDFIKNEVDTAHGVGKLLDAHTVEITDHEGQSTTHTGEFILISTGSHPAPSKLTLTKGAEILDYKSILDLTHIPRRLVIIGGGINALEYATMFGVLGTRVAILNDREDYLPFLDHEIKTQLNNSLKDQNTYVQNNVHVEKVEKNDLRTCTEVHFRSNEEKDARLQVIETEHVLYFGGYQPNTDKLNLEKLNVRTDSYGFIKVDKNFRTAEQNIYAAGDVVGLPAMASVSFVQGRIAACDMFGIPSQEMPSDIPFGIYTIPEIASIGLTENDAKTMDIKVTVGRAYYNDITQADISHLTDGLLKLIFSTDDLKLLGVHIIGEQATDLIHLGQSVMANGGDIRYFIQHVLNYPSYTEAYRIAAFNGVNRVYKAGVKYREIIENADLERKN
ncbi:MAG: Si-specific NAD(P)(+) transhydrogenase [Balneolaceae bacterium]